MPQLSIKKVRNSERSLKILHGLHSSKYSPNVTVKLSLLYFFN